MEGNGGFLGVVCLPAASGGKKDQSGDQSQKDKGGHQRRNQRHPFFIGFHFIEFCIFLYNELQDEQ